MKSGTCTDLHRHLQAELCGQIVCRDMEQLMFADNWRLVAACSNALLLICSASLQVCGIHLLNLPEVPDHSGGRILESTLNPSRGSSQKRPVFMGNNVHVSYHPHNFTAGAAAIAPVCMPQQPARSIGEICSRKFAPLIGQIESQTRGDTELCIGCIFDVRAHHQIPCRQACVRSASICSRHRAQLRASLCAFAFT